MKLIAIIIGSLICINFLLLKFSCNPSEESVVDEE